MDDGTARIELRRKDAPSLWAVIDAEDLELVQQYRWSARSQEGRWIYAFTRIDGKTTYLHRLLTDAGDGTEVDHRDHDGLNNRRSNLRVTTSTNNHGNQRPGRGVTSRYKGVNWTKREKLWRARIKANGIERGLGYFRTEVEAARAYDRAALEVFGEFAYLNFPPRHDNGLMTPAEIMKQYRPGSGHWSWSVEYADISRNWRPGVDDDLLASIGRDGVLEPVLLGDDYRVWEGHHRIIFAHWHDRDRPIPVEYGKGG